MYKEACPFFWPFSSEVVGWGLLPNILTGENYYRDFFGIANTDVLIIGLGFFLVAIIIRIYVEGPAWIRGYMPDRVQVTVFGK